MSTPSQQSYYTQEYIGGTSSTDQIVGVNQNSDQNQHSNHQDQLHSIPSYHGVLHQRPKNYAFTEPNFYPFQQVYPNTSNEYYSNNEYTSNINSTPSLTINSLSSSVDAQQQPSQTFTPQQQYQPHPYGNPNILFQPSNLSTVSNVPTVPPLIRNHQHQSSNTSTVSTTTTNSTNTQQKHSRASSTSTTNNEYPEPVKPRIATTYWEDEKTICYQVKARGVLVSRREDTNFINGTKLLNVIGMTRGKRDGILKTEKNRIVVKVGSMNLKGVWIPFERAAEIARNEGVDNDELLGPLFIKDLKTYYKTKGYKLKIDSNMKDEQIPHSADEDSSPYLNTSNIDFTRSPNNNNNNNESTATTTENVTKINPLFRQEYFDTKSPINPIAKDDSINYYTASQTTAIPNNSHKN